MLPFDVVLVSITRLFLVCFGFGSEDFDCFRFVVDDEVDCDGEVDANELLFDSIPEFVGSAMTTILFSPFSLSDGTRIPKLLIKFL